MNRIWAKKSPIIAGTALLAASLCFANAQTDAHPAPEKHKAPKAEHHTAPKAEHHSAPKATKHSAHKATKHSARKVKKHPRGQAAIDNERARQIQEALVREHYMSGSPSGTWDTATQDAMRRFQADQGWQNKTVPDSRALIRLGLGPDQEHLLNPESAMTTMPSLPHANMHASAVSDAGSASGAAAQASQSTHPVSASDPAPSR